MAFLDKLWTAMDNSDEALRGFRNNRHAFLTDMTGRWYADSGLKSEKPLPLNYMALAMFTLSRFLTAGEPRVLMGAPRRSYRAACGAMEPHINRTARKMNLRTAFEEWAFEAMCSPLSFLILGPNRWSHTNERGEEVYEITADVPDFDDMIIDMGAKRLEMVSYVGHSVRMPLEQARNSPTFNGNKKKLQPSSGNRLSRHSRGGKGPEDYEFEDHVNLRQVFLPQHKILLTLSEEEKNLVVDERDWEGPEAEPFLGPYYALRYRWIPGKITGLPYCATLMDLNILLNTLIRKVQNQAVNQKTIGVYRKQQEEDAKNIRDANDLELRGMTDPDAVREIKFGGVDPSTAAIIMAVREWLNIMSGGIDILAGLGPQSDTATQDQLLLQSASKVVEQMSDKLNTGVREVMRSLVELVWNDKDLDFTVERKAQGPFTEPLEVSMRHEHLPGPLDRQDVELDVYAMTYQTAAMKYNTIRQIWSEFIAGPQAMLQSAQARLNLSPIYTQIAKLTRSDWLDESISFDAPLTASDLTVPSDTAPPEETRRVYERVNRPGTTLRGKEKSIAAMLLNQNLQNSEMAAADRTVG